MYLWESEKNKQKALELILPKKNSPGLSTDFQKSDFTIQPLGRVPPFFVAGNSGVNIYLFDFTFSG
jgi:hypothetical protein